jgi:hypothetical protein
VGHHSVWAAIAAELDADLLVRVAREAIAATDPTCTRLTIGIVRARPLYRFSFETEAPEPAAEFARRLGAALAMQTYAVLISDGGYGKVLWFESGELAHDELIDNGESSGKLQQFARALGVISWSDLKKSIDGEIELELARRPDPREFRAEVLRLRGVVVERSVPAEQLLGELKEQEKRRDERDQQVLEAVERNRVARARRAAARPCSHLATAIIGGAVVGAVAGVVLCALVSWHLYGELILPFAVVGGPLGLILIVGIDSLRVGSVELRDTGADPGDSPGGEPDGLGD